MMVIVSWDFVLFVYLILAVILKLNNRLCLQMQQELKERIERLKEKSCKDGVFTSESEFSDEMMEIRKDFVSIHGEMVLLKNYSSLNFAGNSIFSSVQYLIEGSYFICLCGNNTWWVLAFAPKSTSNI